MMKVEKTKNGNGFVGSFNVVSHYYGHRTVKVDIEQSEANDGVSLIISLCSPSRVIDETVDWTVYSDYLLCSHLDCSKLLSILFNVMIRAMDEQDYLLKAIEELMELGRVESIQLDWFHDAMMDTFHCAVEQFDPDFVKS